MVTRAKGIRSAVGAGLVRPAAIAAGGRPGGLQEAASMASRLRDGCVLTAGGGESAEAGDEISNCGTGKRTPV
ncbi:hypothetical protein GCM10020358_33800 [Amorphoplanes nipponensis]